MSRTRIFAGPVELSEFPTSGHAPVFIGTTLRIVFQVTKDESDIPNGVFPQIRILTERVDTHQEWQQHPVRLNGYLIATIDRAPATPYEFVFAFQPRVLRVDTKPHDPWEMPLHLVTIS